MNECLKPGTLLRGGAGEPLMGKIAGPHRVSPRSCALARKTPSVSGLLGLGAEFKVWGLRFLRFKRVLGFRV